jgi:hypothetical protein
MKQFVALGLWQIDKLLKFSKLLQAMNKKGVQILQKEL